MKRLTLTLVLGLVPVALWSAGCGSSPSSPRKSAPSATDSHNHDHSDHADHQHQGSEAKDDRAAMVKMKETLAKLSEADRQSAEKQHVCPVSGEMLGTMGMPLKVDVNGQQVWICCADCKDKLLENPDMYLAKLKR